MAVKDLVIWKLEMSICFENLKVTEKAFAEHAIVATMLHHLDQLLLKKPMSSGFHVTGARSGTMLLVSTLMLQLLT